VKQDQLGSNKAIEQLLEITAMLRDSEFGCPWDLEQSISSLAAYTLEEVYEVVDAIEQNDMVELEDELGDLLFQVVFYGQIAAEQGMFSFDDVASAISRKLIRRHPHVFPEGKLENFGRKSELSADQVVVNWEAIKQVERDEKLAKGGAVKADSLASVLADVPRALPGLERARKLQKRAASHGFDWKEVQPVIAKLKEEIAELEQALEQQEPQRINDEMGDILFTAVNLSRHVRVEPEMALRSANTRFENRFHWIESKLLERDTELKKCSLAELDELWNQAKQAGL
jgi:nucleoside triphosphate diphosphatase